MSQTAAAARAIPRPATRPGGVPGVRPRTTQPQPRLRVVAPAPSGSRLGLALLSVTLLAVGLLALLLLNISLGRGSYELSASQRQQHRLAETRQALQEEIEAASAPLALAERARELGMVPAPRTAFVRLSDGRVLGKPAEATAPPKPKASQDSDGSRKAGAAGDDRTAGR